MKTIVIYQTKYGSTKEYALWIAHDISADSTHLAALNPEVLASYDTVIFGSYVRMGNIVDVDFITKNWKILEHKHVVLFTVSAAPAGSKVVTEAINKGLPPEIQKSVQIFSFQGRMRTMDTKDTILIACAKALFYVQFFLKGKIPPYNPYAPFDKVNRAAVDPLTTFIRSLQIGE